MAGESMTLEQGAEKIAGLLGDDIDDSGNDTATDDAQEEGQPDLFGDLEEDSDESDAVDDQDEEDDDDAEGSDDEDSDEDEDLEADDEDDEDSEGDDQEEEPTFELDDGTQVSKTELIEGYKRQTDYTRQIQAVDEQAKHLSAKDNQLEAAVKDVITKYETIHAVLAHLMPAKPESTLARENPLEYNAQLAQHQEFQQLLGAVEQQVLQARGDVDSIEKARINDRQREAQLNLVKHDSKYRSLQERQKLAKYIGPTAKKMGIDLEKIEDVNTILLLKDAADLAAIRAGKTKGKKAQERVRKGRKAMRKQQAMPAGKRQAASHKAKVDRLKKTGSLEDAAAAIADIL